MSEEPLYVYTPGKGWVVQTLSGFRHASPPYGKSKYTVVERRPTSGERYTVTSSTITIDELVESRKHYRYTDFVIWSSSRSYTENYKYFTILKGHV